MLVIHTCSGDAVASKNGKFHLAHSLIMGVLSAMELDIRNSSVLSELKLKVALIGRWKAPQQKTSNGAVVIYVRIQFTYNKYNCFITVHVSWFSCHAFVVNYQILGSWSNLLNKRGICPLQQMGKFPLWEYDFSAI